MEDPHRRRNTENFEVILIFGDREDTLCPPNIDDGVGNHASVTAGTSSAERMCMVNEELTREALNNKPWFVRRQDRACTMEFFNVQGTSLSPRWSKSDLSAA